MLPIECAKKEVVDLIVLPAGNQINSFVNPAVQSTNSFEIMFLLGLTVTFLLLLLIILMVVPKKLLKTKKAKPQVHRPIQRPNITFY